MKLKHPKKLFVSLLAGVLTLCPLVGSFENIKASAATEFNSDTDKDGQWNIDESQIKVFVFEYPERTEKKISVSVNKTNNQITNTAAINATILSKLSVTFKIKGTGLTSTKAKSMKLMVYAKPERNGNYLTFENPKVSTNNGIYTVTFEGITACSSSLYFKTDTESLKGVTNLVVNENACTCVNDTSDCCQIEVYTPGEYLFLRSPIYPDVSISVYKDWAKRLAVYVNSLSKTTGISREKVYVALDDDTLSYAGLCGNFCYDSSGKSYPVIRYKTGYTSEIKDYVKKRENRIAWIEMHELGHAYKRSGTNFHDSFYYYNGEVFTDELFTNLRGLTAIQNCDNLHCDKIHEKKTCTEPGCTNIITDGHVLPYDRAMDVHQNHGDIRIALAARFANIANGYKDGWNIKGSNWNATNAKAQGWNVLEAFFNPTKAYKYAENEEIVKTFVDYTGMVFKSDAVRYKMYAMSLYALYDIAKDKGVIINDMSFSDFLTEAFGTYQGDSIIKQYVKLKLSEDVLITEQPTNASAEIGKIVSTKVEAVGEGLKYQWYVKNPNQTYFAKSSITTATYSYVMESEKDGRQVYCEITDKDGNIATTKTVTLGTPVEITEQPTNASALVGKAVKTTVTAEGHGLKYQWYVKNPNQSSFVKSSITDPVYTYVMTEAKDGRQVYCVITDLFGNTVKTDTVTLCIAKLGDVNLDGNIDPRDASMVLSASAAISAGGDPNLTSAERELGDVNRDTVLDSRDAAIILSYSANVSVGYKKSLEEFLASGGVVIVKQPTNASALVGKAVKTTVTAEGHGLKYQWYVKNPNQSSFVKSSITDPVYTYVMTEAKDGRQVYCVITDLFGNEVTTDTVTLGTPVEIVEQPKNVVVPEGTNANIVINAKGDDLTYKWYYKNKGATNFSYTSTFTSKTYSVVMNDARDGRQIYCVISDQYGNSVQTDTVTLTMSK